MMPKASPTLNISIVASTGANARGSSRQPENTDGNLANLTPTSLLEVEADFSVEVEDATAA
jgi:hypothetical protein